MFLTKNRIKTVSLIVESLFVLVGVSMIAVGVLILLREPRDMAEKMSKSSRNFMAVLVIIPALFNITVTLYFGVRGATHLKSPRLFECVKWLSVVLSWTVFFAIYCYFFLSDTEEITKKNLTCIFSDYNVTTSARGKCPSFNTNSTYYRSDYDDIQHEFHCCGVDGPDYWITRNLIDPPPSCFDNYNQTDSGALWRDGCVKKMTEKNVNDIKYEAIDLFVYIVAVEIVVIGITLYLAFKLKEIERRALKRQRLENGTI